MVTYNWTPASDGTWRKELGGLEKVYRFQSIISRETGKEHWGLYAGCTVKFSGSVISPATALRDAWKTLRIQFPALGIIVDRYEAVYHAAANLGDNDWNRDNSTDTLELWAQETFLIERKRTVEEIISRYPLRDLPALIWLPRSSEVVLLVSHWRSDGLGAVMLLNRLMEYLVEPPDISMNRCGNPETELARISPSLEDAVGAPLIPTPGIIEAANNISMKFREKAMKSIGIAYNGDHTTAPGNPAIEAVSFTAESSRSLVQACKVRNITVSAAVHVALAETIFEMSADNVTEYATIMAVNMRPYLKAPYNSDDHACRAYVTSITPVVQKGASFEDSTLAVTELFRNWHCERNAQALREIYKGASQVLLSPPRRPVGPAPNPPNGIMHSNLGVIDRFLAAQYGNGLVEVSEFRFGVSMMTRQMMLYPFSFRGKLNFSINYNDAFYGTTAPRRLLDGIQSKLETELDVKLVKVF
ncbi:hypothetical protein BGW36DRAFT_410500 [Talaromyces proteolyticus]|uniref:Condensation domain-containing protein n=1 Tax=Talaromyces proteolyticus TaxID=1131652 RepID=A0AAD4KGP8_9EURO|nr:uncharacterized protein BGW36DRAFT_410500 [Talaromyces proteolyticus]KAH8691968.1 hypothetical protein BGW36DRAFT_410500 [Talaromyces proteolyticus]